MNMKFKALSIAAVFLMGADAYAQRTVRDTTTKTRNIDEVVVIGYGTQKKTEVTAAISTIKGSAMENLNTPTFESQLAGRSAGVQVVTNSGIIGNAPVVRVRGVNSITSGTSPLYVIDGMPMVSGDTGGGYTGANALGDINPADIESMSVLKDGAATAIYGSRAANGVILITTKKGRNGRFTATYNNLFSVAQAAKKFDLLHTPDFLAITAEKTKPLNLNPASYPNGSWANGSEYDTDWQDAVLRNATQQDHYISLSGGLGKGSFYTSLGYTYQEGIIRPNSMQRYTIRTNADQKVTDWLKIGANIGYTSTNYNGLTNGPSSLSGAIYNATKQLPNTPIYDPTTPTGYNIYTAGTSSMVGPWDNNSLIANYIPNIVYVLDHNKNTSDLTRFLGGVYGEVNLTNWLTYKLQASMDRSVTTGLMYWNRIHGDGFSKGGIIENNYQSLQRWNIQNILTFNKSFDKHNLNLLFVNEIQKQDQNYFFGGGSSLSNDFFGDNLISDSYQTQTSGGSKSQNGIISYMGRLSYNYANRYFLQASLRKDGLSSLPKANKWGTFPGVSVGWTVSNEAFMENIKPTLSDFKLRASWGKVGNSDIGNYPYLGLYGNAKYADNNGIAFVQAKNYQLQWETNIKTDYGFDLGFLHNRITLNADYYENRNDNLILAKPVPPSLGVPGNSINENIGSMVNKGFELAINADIIRKDDFTWSIGGNFTTANNKVLSLVNDKDIPLTYDSGRESYGIIRVGESIRSIYGFRYYGVNTANGNPIYYKKDGSLVQGNIANSTYYVYDPNNPTALTTAASLKEEDKTILGNTLPKYFGSVNTAVYYKGFDLSALVRFSGGNKIYDITRRSMLGMDFTNNSTEILGRWQSAANPGDGWTPALWGGKDNFINYTGTATSRFVEDGSFVKIDNITLGYSLPKDVLDAIKLSKLRFFIVSQNAFIFTKYKGMDPEMEVGGVDYNAVPRQRTFSMGLNATF